MDVNYLHYNLYLFSCFGNVSDSFVHVITLKTLRFKNPVLFRTHTLLDCIIP